MSSERLTRLREKKAKLDEQLRQLEARERDKERKRDTRRKVIAGALALEHAERDAAFSHTLFDLLGRYVTRPADRELFGLPVQAEGSQQAREQDNLSGEFRAAEPGTGTAPG